MPAIVAETFAITENSDTFEMYAVPKLVSREDNLEYEAPIKNSKKKKNIKEYVRELSEKYGLICFPLRDKKKPAIYGFQKLTKTPYDEFNAEHTAYGILCGKASRITVVDIDNLEWWERLLSYFDPEHELDETAIRVKTPSGGFHYIFEYEEEVKNDSNVVKIYTKNSKDINSIGLSGIDTRNDGGYIVGAHSLYSASKSSKECFNGKPYKWLIDFDDVDGEPTKMPEWLLDLVKGQNLLYLTDGTFINYEKPKIVLKQKINQVNNDEAEDCLSKEEAEFVVDYVSAERATNRSTWIRGVWACASLNTDFALDIAYRFSQRTTARNYGGVDEVFRQSKERVLFATMIHWLKEDNYTAFKEFLKMRRNKLIEKDRMKIVKEMLSVGLPDYGDIEINDFNDGDERKDKQKDKQNEVKKNIDPKDTYVFGDFYKAYSDKVFDSFDELCDTLTKDANRVLAKVLLGAGFYIKKDDLENYVYNKISAFTKITNFTVKYMNTETQKVKLPKKKGQEQKYNEFEVTKEESIKLDELLVQLKLNTYNTFVCKPEKYINGELVIQSKPHEFNVWQGFKAKRVPIVDMSIIQPMLDVFREVWASNDDKLYHYIMSWFASLIQKADIPIGVALFLYGAVGSGKNTPLDFFIDYVIGRPITGISNDISKILQKHNTILEGKKLMLINELGSTKEEFRSNFDRIKHYITDSTLLIEPKGINTYLIENISNWIFISNHKDAMHIEANDRRYCCIEVSNVHANDRKYFGKVRESCFNQECGDHFFTYLLEYKCLDCADVKNIPQTQLKTDIQQLSKSSYVLFSEYFAEQLKTEVNERELDYQRIEAEITAHDMYKLYKKWGELNGMRNLVTETKFGLYMKGLYERKKTTQCFVYVLT
jgi:hypothetical protein